MRVELNKKIARHHEMTLKLGSLKPQLSVGGDDLNQLFDEFVREDEWELALHLVCDYLLEPKTQGPPTAAIQQIEALHGAMQITDTCAADLRRKAGRPVSN
jgi:hypothetical protein